jgi:hypothetical protein
MQQYREVGRSFWVDFDGRDLLVVEAPMIFEAR